MTHEEIKQYENFLNYIVVDVLKREFIFFDIERIDITKMDENPHNGKLYPTFQITRGRNKVNTYLEPYRLREILANIIKNETEKFYPNVFNIGHAWIEIKKPN
jgi:hypothetical protein